MAKLPVTTLAALLTMAALPLCATHVAAQTFPSKSIRVVVGFPAGGPADAMARIAAKKMTEVGGQQVLIENRPGANSFLAGEFVARSAPDGHVHWFSSGSTLSYTKQMYSKPLIDPDRDVAVVTQAVLVPQIFVVHPSLPVKTLRDVAQLGARRPGQLNVSVLGLGGNTHLGSELFRLAAGITWTNVQYKGAAPAIIDLMGGHIDMSLYDVPAVVGYLPSGKLRPLAVTSAARVKQLPEVPTTAEAGYPDVRSDSWYGIAVPAATPPELIARVNRLWSSSLRAPDTQSALFAIGAVPVGGTVEEIQALRTVEARKWGDLVRKFNLKFD